MLWPMRLRSTAVLISAMAAVCALLLALPGETITTKYMNDLFIFLDGVHRITQGQVPNRDFHTALGPLVYYVPAVGYWLSGTMGGAMPTAMALHVIALALPAAHILGTRLRPAIALPLAAYLILVVAVPINLGESIQSLSFAMFYNRIGWAALGLLLVMHLRPYRQHRRQAMGDALCAAFLALLMLYTKISYAVVGLAFLGLLLLDSRQRTWAAGSLAIVAATALITEFVWGGSVAYIGDLVTAGRVSGNLDTIDELAQVVFRNLADFVLFAMFMGLVLWRVRHVRDFLYYGLCVGAGFMLITQNFQNVGIVSLGAGAAVAAETLARTQTASKPGRSLLAGAQLLLLALLLPTTVHNAAALSLHAGLALTNRGQPVPLPHFERIRLVRLWTDGDYPTFSRYLESLEDGARALANVGSDRVLVLDFVSPFSAGLRLKPPQGDSTWYHWGRTIDDSNHLPPETLFREVQVLMEPKWPVEVWTAEGMRRIYSDYVAENFRLLLETVDWKLYVPAHPTETVSRTTDADAEGQQPVGVPPSGG